jgi:hypothetical protein
MTRSFHSALRVDRAHDRFSPSPERQRPYGASEFFKNDLFEWFAGAMLLFGGLFIIAFHQYWSSVAAIMISLFGWVLALRGLVLMAAPELYQRAGMAVGTILFVYLIFGFLVAVGAYLTYVGWLTGR